MRNLRKGIAFSLLPKEQIKPRKGKRIYRVNLIVAKKDTESSGGKERRRNFPEFDRKKKGKA